MNIFNNLACRIISCLAIFTIVYSWVIILKKLTKVPLTNNKFKRIYDDEGFTIPHKVAVRL